MTRALATLGALTLAGAAVILAAAWDRERRLDRAAGWGPWPTWDGEAE